MYSSAVLKEIVKGCVTHAQRKTAARAVQTDLGSFEKKAEVQQCRKLIMKQKGWLRLGFLFEKWWLQRYSINFSINDSWISYFPVDIFLPFSLLVSLLLIGVLYCMVPKDHHTDITLSPAAWGISQNKDEPKS